ncbi:spt-5 [Pristionchus pacificus]|uniref:Transcription elongation factor SPT5 n=1 Tax=Pristionchus pacificus TaxID=54126 RepID=A0A454XL28_PRIPA|nr:spt-5 [Pristionchus pacificus]|eukprot:PDM75481.1 spt-5 [Pristionchus pacificus]
MSSDESDDADFEPKQNNRDDDDDDMVSDPESEEDQKSEESPKKKSKKRKIESDDDDEDSEEDEDSDDDRHKKKKKKKNRRPRGMDFILDDVEVDSDDAEEEEYESGDDTGLEPKEREEAEKRMRQMEAERRKKEEKRAAFLNMPEEDIEKYFEEKYKNSSSGGANFDDDDALDDISQHGLLPSTKDPNLWIVKCMRMGEEKLVAMQLMRKMIAYENRGEPLQIKSVVVKEGLKGLIYIEAFKQSHVAQAIDGISALNSFTITMVQIKEMVEVLRVVKDIPTLKQGMYVRMKRTMFKDDLAQVDWVDISEGKVGLRLLPRIDYTRMRGALRSENDKLGSAKKKKPAPRPFDIDRIKEIGGEVTQDGDFHIFEGSSYRRGFLYKAFPINAIMAEGVKPTLAELEKFQETSDDLKRELELTSVSESAHSFAPGDLVEVSEGELLNLIGKIQSVDGDKVVILPEHEDLKEPLTLNAWEIKKRFKQGDHVKILAGRYEGDTGLVVRVENNLVVVLSDLSMHEMKVRPRDCQLCADVTTGVDSLGQFQFHDLVMLDAQTVGVIVRLEKENLEVLNQHGKVVRVKPQSIQAKKLNHNVTTTDSQQNSIQVKDVVKVVEGPYATKRDREDEKQGEILHIFRFHVFVHSRKHTENGGIFVVKARHLLLVGAKGGDKRNDLPQMNRLLSSPNPYASPRHPGLSSPAHSSGRTSGGQTPSSLTGGPGGGPKQQHARRDTAIIGKNVKIIGGPLKGHFGIVKDATETTCRVEMHSSCKTMSVDRCRVMEVGDDSVGFGSGGVSMYTKTPMQGGDSRTPMYGGSSKTPMYGGSATPMYGAGGKTPMYGGAHTPGHDGGRTPHYAGNATPHYGADGGRTPAYGGDGSRTPHWGDGGASTPARHNIKEDDDPYDAPASPAYNVPTPGGMNFNPRTPGGFDYTAPSPMTRNYSIEQAIPAHFLESGDWMVENLVVEIKNHDDDRFVDSEGIITSVDQGSCTLFVPSMRKQCRAEADQVVPVRPQQGDWTRIIYGDDMGVTGVLKSEFDNEGVLTLDDDTQRATTLAFLCKLHRESR